VVRLLWVELWHVIGDIEGTAASLDSPIGA